MKTHSLMTLVTALLLSAVARSTETAAQDNGVTKNPDSRGRSTAVALNYCRASFHRIRRIQSKRVLIEEKEKILNNLNLNGIGDAEVIKLYSGVLDEISQIDIAEREATAIKDKYKKAVHRQIGTTTFFMAAQFATLSMESMARTGVNSWLDYRDLRWAREFDQWKVEKNRIQAVVDKSSKFLDTFWKLAQKKNIPDRWLVRGNDLDNLAEAVAEENLETRLRVLKRMEPFMECFPPYWYYVARTQQGLGKLYDAVKTYDKLADLAAGHFRRDDMLAASLANRAIIQEYLEQDGAERSALEALQYSSAVWEANLMCAQVLERHDMIDEAEDAILRNLDVELEVPRSATALLGLYYRENRTKDIARTLNNVSWLPQIPVVSLVQASKKLPGGRIPPKLLERFQQTIGITVDRNFGADDLLLICDPIWQASSAQISIRLPSLSGAQKTSTDEIGSQHRQQLATGETIIRFRGVTESGNPLRQRNASLAGTVVELRYQPKTSKLTPLRITFGPPIRRTDPRATWWPAASPIAIQFGDTTLDLRQTALTIAQRPEKPERQFNPQRKTQSPNKPAVPKSPKDKWQTTKDQQIANNQNASSKRLENSKPSGVIPSARPRPSVVRTDRRIPRISILGVREIEPNSRPERKRKQPVPPPPE
jgi:hypothetical protein